MRAAAAAKKKEKKERVVGQLRGKTQASVLDYSDLFIKAPLSDGSAEISSLS